MSTSQPTERTILFSYLALAAGVICMGFSGIFVKWANAPGPVTGFYRMIIVVLLLAITLVWVLTRSVTPSAPTAPNANTTSQVLRQDRGLRHPWIDVYQFLEIARNRVQSGQGIAEMVLPKCPRMAA